MIEDTPKIKYFIYCRKSSDDEDRQILSIPAQKRELKEFAEKNNLEIAGIFSEERSAYKIGRPEFNKMMGQIELGIASGLVVWNVNRIARNSKDGGNVIYAMDERKIIEIRTPSKIYRNEPDDKFYLQIEFTMAKKSSDDNARDTVRGIREKIERKEPPLLAPKGFLNIDKDGKIVGKQYNSQKQILLEQRAVKERRELKKGSWEIDPLLAKLVEKVFLEINKGKHSLIEINKMACKWGLNIKKSQFYRMIQNPAYYGGVYKYKGILHESNHEGIISKALWDKVQEKIKDGAKPRKIVWEWNYAGGFVKCGECGYSIVCYTKTKPSGRQYSYATCSKRGKGGCSQKHIRLDELERQIGEAASNVYIDKRVLNVSLKLLKLRYGQQIENQNKMREQWQKQIIVIEQKLKRLLDLRIDGEINEKQFSEKKNELMALKKDYNENITDADVNTEGWLERAEKFYSDANIVTEILEHGTPKQRKDLVGKIGWNFRLKDGKLTWEYRKPYDQLIKSKSLAIQTGEWLELQKSVVNSGNLGDLRVKFPIWGDLWDSNP